MERTLTPQEAIEALKASTEVTVGPELIAAALRMSPSVLRKHVRDGEYNISAYDIQGSRIRFFRKDFLQKTGEIPPDPPEYPSTEKMLQQIWEAMMEIRILLKAIANEKTAGAATPTV